jgi:hypothetical protein
MARHLGKYGTALDPRVRTAYAALADAEEKREEPPPADDEAPPSAEDEVA